MKMTIAISRAPIVLCTLGFLCASLGAATAQGGESLFVSVTS